MRGIAIIIGTVAALTVCGRGWAGPVADVSWAGSVGSGSNLVTWHIAGEVTFLQDEPGILAQNGIRIGTPFSGSFTFDPDTPDSDPDNPMFGTFRNAVTTLSGTVGDVPFVWAASPPDIYVYLGGPHSYDLRGTVTLLDRTEAVYVLLHDYTRTTFSTDELPLVPPPLDRFDVRWFAIGAQESDIEIRGDIYSLVPEPATLVLLGLGCATLLRPGSRRRLSRRGKHLRLCLFAILSVAGVSDLATPANAQEVCGCMDMVFLVDMTGSFSDSDRDKIREDLRLLVEDTALVTSGGDLRLGFITFGDRVNVRSQLNADVPGVLDQVDAVLDNPDEVEYCGGEASLPEPSDQALAEMLGWPLCLDDCRPYVFADVPFRGECIKHAILITDNLPEGCDMGFQCPKDKNFALAMADEAAAQGIIISALLVNNANINCGGAISDEDADCSDVYPAQRWACIIMNYYAEQTGGVFAVLPDNASGIEAALDDVVAWCPDCNTNQVNDLCDINCSAAPGCVPQQCGGSEDCENNAVPDECKPFLDCNNNSVRDACDIATGTSLDCYRTLSTCCTPQEGIGGCASEPEVEQCVCGSLSDCCDIEWTQDCANLAVPCGLDCCDHADRIPDECNVVPDCNGNGIPDLCDLRCDVPGGFCDQWVESCGGGADCNANCVLDECEEDCNDNEIPDDCEVPESCGGVCTANCDPDCNCNGVPDACDADCNDNQIPDDCDISSGTSCDIDGNGVPDECRACCEWDEIQQMDVCHNRVSVACFDGGGSFFAGATCDECVCAIGACCNESNCTPSVLDCECREDGGFSLAQFTTSCSGNPCSEGACCTQQGQQCADGMSQQYCNGTYVGGARCSDDPCVAPSSCPAPTEFSVLSPVVGTYDARQPHPPGNSSLSARQGIGGPNQPSPDPITIRLGVSGANMCCWQLCESGIEPIEAPTPQLNPNRIISVQEDPAGTYKVLLERPISGQYWTRLTYVRSGDYVEYASLPADASGDHTSGPADILTIINNLNGQIQPPLPKSQCDMDRSNVCGPSDILRIIDLLNGADRYIPWLGRTLQPNRCADGAMRAGMPSGGATVTDSARAYALEELDEFANGFVRYLATTKPLDSAADAEFKLVVEALTGFCVQNLSPDQRPKLAERLQDPSVTFASETAAAMVPEIVNALIK